MTDQTVDVTLTPEGTVEIGTPPAGPGAHFFPVFGGLVGVDVTDPDRTPFTSIGDIARTAWWLGAVYGDDVASAASRMAPPEDDASDEAGDLAPASDNVHLQPGRLWDPLVRFGIGTWIKRWWPSSDAGPRIRLDETLMDLEVGVLAWALEFVLGGTAVVRDHLEDHVGYVLDDLENGSPDNALLAPVLRALIESVPADDQLYDTLREQEERLVLVTEATEAMIDGVIEQWYAEQERSEDHWTEPLRVRGGSRDRSNEEPLAQRSFPIDVEQVPARSISWAPRAVTASLRQERGELLVQLTVKSGDVLTELPLYARVYFDSDLVPTTVMHLTTDGLGQYVGSERLDGRSQPADFLVDVFTPSLMASPDPARAKTLREAVGPLLDELAEAARTARLDDEPVDELKPRAPWRALVAGARLRG